MNTSAFFRFAFAVFFMPVAIAQVTGRYPAEGREDSKLKATFGLDSPAAREILIKHTEQSQLKPEVSKGDGHTSSVSPGPTTNPPRAPRQGAGTNPLTGTPSISPFPFPVKPGTNSVLPNLETKHFLLENLGENPMFINDLGNGLIPLRDSGKRPILLEDLGGYSIQFKKEGTPPALLLEPANTHQGPVTNSENRSINYLK